MMKKISILGSTGSIGQNGVKCAKHLGYEVTALAAKGGNLDLLEQQAKELNPQIVAVFDEDKALTLKKRLPHTKVVGGKEGILEAALTNSDLVLSAISGAIGLHPTIEAIRAGKSIALANKEVLVSAGSLVMSLAKEKGVEILPVDSEHSAIFQCIQGEELKEIDRIILTASGGPFRDWPKEKLHAIALEDALKHPNWSMGSKITIDSSTLMNKGLEVIEACYLFDLAPDQVDVVIHPESIVHSFVEFVDGSLKAQVSEPTMIVPIQYAFTYPKRGNRQIPRFDFMKERVLQFHPPDVEKFPSLSMAYESLKLGGSAPCFLNAANEVLVDRFMKREISWLEILRKLGTLLERHSVVPISSHEDVNEVDAHARVEAQTI